MLPLTPILAFSRVFSPLCTGRPTKFRPVVCLIILALVPYMLGSFIFMLLTLVTAKLVVVIVLPAM